MRKLIEETEAGMLAEQKKRALKTKADMENHQTGEKDKLKVFLLTGPNGRLSIELEGWGGLGRWNVATLFNLDGYGSGSVGSVSDGVAVSDGWSVTNLKKIMREVGGVM